MWRLWLKQRFCNHWWRPALTTGSAAKVCTDCGKLIRVVPAEFYAEFGPGSFNILQGVIHN